MGHVFPPHPGIQWQMSGQIDGEMGHGQTVRSSARG